MKKLRLETLIVDSFATSPAAPGGGPWPGSIRIVSGTS